MHRRHPRHALHPWHSLHRQPASQIGRAVGAVSPAQFQQALALGAGAFQLLAAGWADLEVWFNTCVAIAACLPLGHLGQQRFLFQLPLVDFGQGLPGPQDHVDEQAAHEKHGNQHRRGDLQNQVLRARANIAERPDDQTEPENDHEGNKYADHDTQRIHQTC